MKKINIEDLSADELYKLAEKKKQSEMDAQNSQVREELQALKESRKQLQSDYRKELAKIERHIASLSKKIGLSTPSSGGSRGLSKLILQHLQSNESASTDELRAMLQVNGVKSNNINQQLAYLKRKGQITNSGRGIYQAC